jgi:serine-type D-Ala-D-Ala carboxypeptidase/endopeptidase (penicillin-binding protein 4)
VSKLPSSIAALEILGPDHTFGTRLLASGPVRDGVLQGDLILSGEGDPYLSLPDVLSLAERLGRVGITRITGRFLFDESWFPSLPFIDSRQHLESVFNPPVSSLSFEVNLATLLWQPRAGSAAGSGEVETFWVPPLEGVGVALAPSPFPLDERLKVSPTPPPAPALELYLLSPTAGTKGSARLPIRRPAYELARLVRRYAESSGVVLPVPEAGSAPANASVLVAHQSPPLLDLTQSMLGTSDNLMAELIGLAAARRLNRTAPASLASASHTLLEWWRERLPRVKLDSVRLENCSGLNEDNRLTPRAIVAMLEHASRKTWGERTFGSLLSSAGWRGTLATRLSTPETSTAVWGKTGTMDYGIGLAGEMSVGPKRWLFAILVSDVEKRHAAQERRVREGDSKALEAEAEAWAKQARALADSLVREWTSLAP